MAKCAYRFFNSNRLAFLDFAQDKEMDALMLRFNFTSSFSHGSKEVPVEYLDMFLAKSK